MENEKKRKKGRRRERIGEGNRECSTNSRIPN